MRLLGESRADLPRWSKNGLREQAKEPRLGLLWWLESGARLRVPTDGLNLPLRSTWDFFFFFKVSFSRCKAEREEGGERLKSCMQSNFQKWSQILLYNGRNG